ncbi:thioredoxin [Alkalilimnicola sp. S0819]|uniref:thioredoxin n=1 Tax=Alkalilimnicola sp. S0819 TaxID=2613922 RepID=UPI00126209F9|nr:thioredoxin [Alkalilimnicola sp. S0819]KAB7622805.1 thioredoxin [Alkalilimnicola sp. S0819]MPQ17301.1 thioredoxin [Alkalilimnicola sp. S0819]
MAGAIKISDSDFEQQVLQSKEPVLVDYWAEWCGPCKMLSPILDQVAEEYAGKVRVVKLNIDDNPETPQRFGVRGIPTLMLFKDGQPQGTKVGAMPKQALTGFIEESLAD